MINKKEFDLLLQEIFRIESKIEEVKILNKFDIANEFEDKLVSIKLKAKEIVLDAENQSKGFDDISLEVFNDLLNLDSEVEFFVLKTNNTIESSENNLIDREAIEKVKQLWEYLDNEINKWNLSKHNPIEEIEFSKFIGQVTLENTIFQLQVEAIIDFPKIFKYCKKEYLINAIKEVLFQGAKEEFDDTKRRNRLVDLAKNIVEDDLYDYKLWQQILMIKNIRSKDSHIEMIGSIRDIDNRKYEIEFEKNQNYGENKLEVVDDGSIINAIRIWFTNFKESAAQKKYALDWGSIRGPAFKTILTDGSTKYLEKYIDKKVIENTKELVIASNGIAKYYFDKNTNWDNLEHLSFLEEKKSACINLSPDKSLCCIGKETFSNCKKLEKIEFGKIEIIGDRAFQGCTNLREIVFPENIMNIGDDAFLDCTNLKKVTFLGDLKLYIMQRPQNIINCFKGTNIEEIIFANLQTAFDFAIANCPKLKRIIISSSNISIPFKICKYRIGREEGIVSFIGENSINLWKKRNSSIRFFELTEQDKKDYNII